MTKLQLVNATLGKLSQKQLAAALIAAALAGIKCYVHHNPLPENITEEQAHHVIDEMLAIALTDAINEAAAVMLEAAAEPTKEDADKAKAVAEAAIAKAAGKLQ